MSDSLPIPSELQHLIEKRSGEDQRHAERRNESPELDADDDNQRRASTDRRQEARRQEDEK